MNRVSSALDVAKSISEGLARKVLAASINGEVWDATRPINTDASLKLLTWDDADGKATFWHSSAHLMAEAVEAMFPGSKILGWPGYVKKGFIMIWTWATEKLLKKTWLHLEKKMNELAKQNNSYIRKEISKAEAVNYFTEKGDEYKLDLLSNLNRWRNYFLYTGRFYRSLPWATYSHIPVLLKPLNLTVLPVLTGKAMKKINSLPGSMGLLSPIRKNWMNICYAGRS